MYFEPGSLILHEMAHVDESGRTGPAIITDVKPMYVVEDGPGFTALYIPAGAPTILARPTPPGRPKPWVRGEYELAESTWSRWHSLFLMRPGEWHATWLRWSPDWSFQDWYVNLQEPFVRSEHGFLVRDLQLDIVVAPDRTWRWKDVADLDRSVELGVIGGPAAERARTEAARMVADIEAGKEPFTLERTNWRPTSEWTILALPAHHHAGETVDWAVANPLDSATS